MLTVTMLRFLTLTSFFMLEFCSCCQPQQQPREPQVYVKYAVYGPHGSVQECRFGSNRCVKFDWDYIVSKFKYGNISDLSLYKKLKEKNNTYYETFESAYPEQYVSYLVEQHGKYFLEQKLPQNTLHADFADQICEFIGSTLVNGKNFFKDDCTIYQHYYGPNTNRVSKSGSISSFMKELHRGNVYVVYSNSLMSANMDFYSPTSIDAINFLLRGTVNDTMKLKLEPSCQISINDFDMLNEANEFREKVQNFLKSSLQQKLTLEECSVIENFAETITHGIIAARWLKNNEDFGEQFLEFLINKTLECFNTTSEEKYNALFDSLCAKDKNCNTTVLSDVDDNKEKVIKYVDQLVDDLIDLCTAKLGTTLGQIAKDICESRGPPLFPTEILYRYVFPNLAYSSSRVRMPAANRKRRNWWTKPWWKVLVIVLLAAAGTVALVATGGAAAPALGAIGVGGKALVAIGSGK